MRPATRRVRPADIVIVVVSDADIATGSGGRRRRGCGGPPRLTLSGGAPLDRLRAREDGGVRGKKGRVDYLCKRLRRVVNASLVWWRCNKQGPCCTVSVGTCPHPVLKL